MTDTTLARKPVQPGDFSWVDSSTFLRCEVGSGLHGISDGTPNDTDEMGVCLEPLPLAIGVRWNFEQYIYRTAAEREGRHDAPSQPGDLDLTVYSLRKWVRLALDGNPSVLLLLFAPASHTRVKNALGSQLQELAPAFASKRAGARFLGYLQQQRQRLLGERGQKNVNRRDLVDKYGYDTKYAGHMLRLGYQGIEYMETGAMTLPMPVAERQRVLDVRQGRAKLNDVLTEVGQLEQRLKDLQTTSPLSAQPDTATVETWMLDTYYHAWASTWGMAYTLSHAQTTPK